eukprot:TRINITY_DN2741_c1_g3_i1.p1 TRINITY_DN2741_c1_g3~~TRINITY_DN2741_c1_g3_i1.p1  ORF type:complete len:235 (+),score=24.00 TRINITY_DN2741_c1_g3_i1:288-992(+)
MESFSTQIPALLKLIQNITSAPEFENGYHFLGHSQGGLIMRSLSMLFPHKIHTLISLAGVQNGVYGFAPLKFLGPFQGLSDKLITSLLYSSLMQETFSVASYWHSLDQPQYESKCGFLPVINGLVSRSFEGVTTSASQRKANFLRTKKMIYFGSPSDGTVGPWNTSLFSFFNNSSASTTAPMQQQNFFLEDTFGLRSMDERGSLNLVPVEGVEHSHWLRNETIFVENVISRLLI